MKHIIFTRFYCVNLGILDDIFSDKILCAGYDHLNNFLIPSLENQTNKNFTLAILVHDELETKNNEIFNKLHNLNTKLNYDVVLYSDIIKYCDSFDEKYFIFTRIDIDDCIFRDGVKLTQDQFNSDLDFKFFAFMNGCTMCTNNMYELHEFISPVYDGYSSFSVFVSFFVNWNVFKLVPMYDHTKLKLFCDENNIQLNDKNCIHDYKTPCAFIWVQHGLNGSVYANGTQHHVRNKVLSLNKEKIKYLFGI